MSLSGNLGKIIRKYQRINHSNSEQCFELFLVLTRLAIGLVLKELSGSGHISPKNRESSARPASEKFVLKILRTY